jgi:hypothetical protein
VHHNYIHHCRRTGFGYGVAVSGCSALIEANLFDYNRHSIMGTRGYPLSSYEARYNVFEVHNVTGQSCDMHGGNDISDATVPAGGTINIHHNTFKAIWNAVNIRGVPTDQTLVYNNWALHEDWNPMKVFMQSLGNLPGHTPYERMKVYDNWYGTSAPPSSDSEPTPTNQPPATPSAPSGTQQGKTGTSYTYWAKTTDPDGDSISYTFDWGDGSTVASILKSSGATISATYSWANAGTYLIKVRGTDSNGNASAWSPTLTVGIVTAPEPAAIPNSPPTVPAAPSGTTNGKVSSEYQYSAVTTDPEGDTLQYTFDWGDGSNSTTTQINSGVTATANHAWGQPGTYAIQVKATDSKGAVSALSPALSVSIVSQPVATSNSSPAAPAAPSGTAIGKPSTDYQYSAITTDPDADTLLYTFDWGDGSNSTTTQINSGVTATTNHAWGQPGTYAIQVKATDSKGAVSASSSALSVSILNQPEIVPSDPSDMAGREEPATPDSGSVDTLAAPAQVTSPAVTPAVQTPSGSPSIGPSDAVDGDASGSPSDGSLDSQGSPLVPAHGSGFVWWLFSVSVIMGAAVLLIGAVVRDTISEPPGW